MEVKDNDLRKTVDEVDRKLDALYAKWMSHFKTAEMKPTIVNDFVFSEDEEKAWFQSERDFTKRIAAPIPTKRQRRVTRWQQLAELRQIAREVKHTEKSVISKISRAKKWRRQTERNLS